MRACVLISGRGSNAEALIREADTYDVNVVISNRPGAPGLGIAARLGVKHIVEPSVDAIGGMIDDMAPDLVCMAGFMRILPARVVESHTVMNVHPSLLPKYPGLHAVRQALADGAAYSGCTVHFADSGVDTGRIIAQSVVPVEPGDTEESLTARILEREHRIYVSAVRWHAQAEHNTAACKLRGSVTGNEHTVANDAIRGAALRALGALSYVRRTRNGYAIDSTEPDSPPYAAVTPDDDIGTIEERLRRLAQALPCMSRL